MSEYVITFDDEDWFFEYAHEKYTHFFGCPIEEIVRCRNCKHYNDHDEGCSYFVLAKNKLLHIAYPDGYCAWGVKK